MQFAEFAARAAEIEDEPGDLATVDHVCDLLGDAGTDLPVVVRFLQGRVFPAWDATTLDIGPALLHEAIARAAGQNVDADDVEAKLADVGEIGAVAATYEFGGQRGLSAFSGSGPDELTVAEVDEQLREIAATIGEGSERRRLDTLFGLFNRASASEAKFLARLVLGEMRIGVGEGTVRDAIAEAFLDIDVEDTNADGKENGDANADIDADEQVDADGDTDADPDDPDGAGPPAESGTPDSARVDGDDTDDPVVAVEHALQVSNDYGMVARVARESGREGLDDVGLEVGRPVQAMLAQAGSATEAIDEWGEAVVETKFDGARVQVHYDGETTALFSRNMDDVTDPLPEVVEFVESAIDVPVVLDGEVVAVDDDGSPLPFQEVLRRFRRKYDVEQMREEVRVELRAFDCLHADGGDLLDAPLVERHDRLAELLGDTDAVSDISVAADPDEVATVEEAALDAGHEGIMLKDPQSTYAPGKRGRNWLKRKPDVETLDLVVTGAEWGEGRRANLLGTFLLSARTDGADDRADDGTAGGDAYVTLGKVATGITDEELESLTERLTPHIEHEDGQTVSVEPAVVFEVGYEEIQQSPTYSSGYALRFPRFVGVREDKSPADADSLDRVERLADEQ
ncbi:ATP-dependent DNA ligase LigA [Halobellus sp. H-GB7]|uniref:ATP-dependent DNA ligase LigA n=1 Tax=Halobellus sp. H-GB7 TaxID=3069756 RepID=UPI0027AFC5A9|nr:ATP-dependent DNA ligase LigA [Halobellus sp. H-GB7]MDQ2054149.1 ATP-dependent DNA ligase LigA [Halobellus sp. H-GB7]